MKYIGEFTTRDNEDIEVLIISHQDESETVEITMSGEPVIISGKTGDSIYTPVKGYEATIEFLSDNYYFDMYSSTVTGTSVIITNKTDGKILFRGYLTPCIYEQDFVSLDKIQLSAVSSLSTLENIKYETTSRETKSFKSIILNILGKVGLYEFYFPNNIRLTDNSSNILNNIFISEEDFFDDDDEQTPWSCKEVLEEIAKYFGVTCTMINGEVWFIDYDRIKNGNTIYNYYSEENVSTVDIDPDITLKKDSFRNADMAISLDETYGKITVNSNTYEIDNLFPDDPFDEKNMTIIPEYSPYITYLHEKTKSSYKHFLWWTWDHQTVITEQKEIFVKYYNPKYITTSWYDGNNVYISEKPPYDFVYTSSTSDEYKNFNKTGCAVIKEAHYDKLNVEPSSLSWRDYIIISNGIKKGKDAYDDLSNTVYYDTPTLDEEGNLDPFRWGVQYWDPFLEESVWKYPFNSKEDAEISANRIKSQFRSSGYLLMEDTLTNPSTPVFNFKSNLGIKYSSGNSNKLYLIFQGNAMLTEQYILPVSDVSESLDPTELKTQNYSVGGFNIIPCRLKIGNKYWNGSYWTTEESTFSIKVGEVEKKQNKNGSYSLLEHLYIDKWMPFRNDVSYTMGLDCGDGVAVPLPSSQNLSGDVEFSIYAMKMKANSKLITPKVAYWEEFPHWGEEGEQEGGKLSYIEIPIVQRGSRFCIIKDLKIGFYSSDKDWYNTEKDDKDIIYTNVIDDSFYGEFDDIELKINTQVDGKLPSRSSVMTSDGYVTKLYDSVLRESKIPEERIVEKYYKHYRSPKKKLSFTTKDPVDLNKRIYWDYFENETFVVDSFEYNVKNNERTVYLVEL